jgi:integrase/recombinase XerC
VRCGNRARSWPQLIPIARAHVSAKLSLGSRSTPLAASQAATHEQASRRVVSEAGAAWQMANLATTPHVFRHTTAVHLISAGVDVTVIRSWLGHASLDTTNHYAQASLETKRKALEKVDSKLRSTKPPRWKRDAELLAWLDSL